jgi:hypothetical protein
MEFQDIEMRKQFNNVLDDIIAATHCHSCNHITQVCLLGYNGRYCDKWCWKDLFRTDHVDCVNNCKYCIKYIKLSLAKSKYDRHRYFQENTNGIYWPMSNKECNNECIRQNDTVRIKGYNC